MDYKIRVSGKDSVPLLEQRSNDQAAKIKGFGNQAFLKVNSF